jgi:anti-sigma factor RsiW
MTEQHYEALMVRVVDDTATPAEREALMAYLAQHPDKRTELDAQKALRALTDGWVERLEHDLAHDAHQAGPLARAESWLGWALLLAATGIFLGGAGVEIWADPEAPLWVQLSLSLGAGGCLVLLMSAIRWRMATVNSDPYKEVIR